VINYEKLHDFVVNMLPTLGHVPLLESLGERIISFCFEDPRIEEVRVRLTKNPMPLSSCDRIINWGLCIISSDSRPS